MKQKQKRKGYRKMLGLLLCASLLGTTLAQPAFGASYSETVNSGPVNNGSTITGEVQMPSDALLTVNSSTGAADSTDTATPEVKTGDTIELQAKVDGSQTMAAMNNIEGIFNSPDDNAQKSIKIVQDRAGTVFYGKFTVLEGLSLPTDSGNYVLNSVANPDNPQKGEETPFIVENVVSDGTTATVTMRYQMPEKFLSADYNKFGETATETTYSYYALKQSLAGYLNPLLLKISNVKVTGAPNTYATVQGSTYGTYSAQAFLGSQSPQFKLYWVGVNNEQPDKYVKDQANVEKYPATMNGYEAPQNLMFKADSAGNITGPGVAGTTPDNIYLSVKVAEAPPAGGGGGSHTWVDHGFTVALDGTKTLNGIAPAGKQYTFLLKDADGKVLQTVQSDNGKIHFEDRVYKAGEYTYTIVEQAGSDENTVYDSAVYTVKVKVVEDGAGYKVESTNIVKNGEPFSGLFAFANTSKEKEPEQPIEEPTVQPGQPSGNPDNGSNVTEGEFEPGHAINPTTPATTAVKDGAQAGTKSAQPATGDNSPIQTWAFITLVAALGILASGLLRKKQQTK